MSLTQLSTNVQVPQDMVGKVAFITGSAKNMGKDFAIALAKRGCNVVIHHRRSPVEAEATAQEIHALGRKTLIIQSELDSVTVVEPIFAQILATFGHIDIVVNNVGKAFKKSIAETTEAEFDDIFSVNAKVPFFIMRECAKHMADNGRIISIATTLVTMTLPLYSAYAGAKTSLEHYSRSLSKEIGDRGITVNTIAPGPIDTPFFHDAEDAQTEGLFKFLGGRLGKVDEVTSVVEFLASPGSQWVTAQTIFVNGGIGVRS